MLIIGAKGHAKEVLDILSCEKNDENIIFYDNVSNDLPEKLYDIFPIFRKDIQVVELFKIQPQFILGLGGNTVRRLICSKMENLGGIVTSLISSTTKIGKYDVALGRGVNIMHNVLISSSVSIGKGVLINSNSAVHHDVSIGDFCEIAPSVEILGGCTICKEVFIGASAVILPGVVIGEGSVIGAGAVVRNSLMPKSRVAGVPAKNIVK